MDITDKTDELRALAARHRLPLSWLLRFGGLPPSTVHRWKQGAVPTPGAEAKLDRCLAVGRAVGAAIDLVRGRDDLP